MNAGEGRPDRDVDVDVDAHTVANTDALYDAYLDACLAGTAEDPAVWCARHGVAAPELLERFAALHAFGCGTRSRDPGAAAGADPSDDPADVPSDDALPFDRLGEFRLVRRLDQGGMGTVYLARQESLGRNVALKVIRPELSRSPEAVERFRREARALAKLRHPNIVAVHGGGEDRGVQYLAMELVPGRSLEAIVADASARGGTLEPSRVLAWGRDLARALASAHDEGVVHRDVKPSNVRIALDGRPLLIDFGIARDAAGDGPTLTRTFAGSPLYAAPEQLAGAAVDGRADVYGLGATLYRCLTGRVPHAGGSMEQVLARALTEEPLPPRRLNPAVPRDAETVVLHALEKDPERRYATAAAFADDLDAVLTSRPVAARPPGALGRARKWCRRRPVPAAVAATLAVAVVVGAAILVSRDRAAAQERRDRAASIVADARERLAAYRRSRESAATLDAAVAERRIAVSTRYQTAEEDAAADGTEDAAAAARRARDTGFFEVLDLLRAAELLDPGTPGTEPIRAELFREKWLEARVARDREGAAFYRDLVGRHDAEGRFARELDGVVRLSFRTDPPGAKVWLFDVHEQAEVVAGGEHRLVPVPPPGAPFPVAPGTPCLRVVRGADDGVKRVEPDDLIVSLRGRPAAEAFLVMRATAGPGAPTGVGRVHGGDRLVSVDGVPVRSRTDLAEAAASTGEPRLFTFERDGRTFDVGARSLGALDVEVWDPERCAEWGGPAQVVRDGRAEDVVLPRGLVVRTTVAPVLLSEASALGRTPVDGVEVAEGLHVAVVEAPGRPRVRLAFRAAPGDQVVRSIRLPPAGPAPDGFVFIPGAEDLPAFWMMEREVTAAEYLEFLNDPAVRARIAASPDPVLFPRTPENRREGGSWRRDAEGRFVLPPGAAPDLPVLGVSWHDAREYAAWRSARDAGQDVARDPEHPARAPYRLPTFREWVFAADGNSGRSYPFGDRFHARWVKSCFARPHAGPEPVRSYPVDESAYGVFDLCGSAYEWADGWWDESRGLRRLAGGSWAQGEVARFNAYGGSGAEASFAGEETGFRLVFPAEAAGR